MRFAAFALVPLTLLGTAAARADDPRARALAPFLDNDVIAVGRLNLAKLDVEKLAGQLIADKQDAAEATQALAPWLAALRQAGAREMYILVVLPELISPSQAPFSAIVPLADGANAQTIGHLLCGGGAVKGPWQWPTCATIHHAVFAGTNEALERIRQVKPVERPELGAALAALGDTHSELVLMPSADSRRVVEELLPVLPQELGGGPITAFTRGLKWAAAGLSGDAEPRLQLLAQGTDAAAARALNDLGKNFVRFLRESKDVARVVPDFGRLADDVRSEVNEDRVSVVIDPGKAGSWADAIIKPMRQTAGRTQCVNNLKQIALALHNYHSAHNEFPPAYTVDKQGKPLLSWRVLILPYIEQDALYKEFRLDEPWDSPHNKGLIDRIPPPYLCPSAGFKRADLGKTTYLTPRGKATIFPGPEGVKIQKITDGTSNTIFVVDAPRDRAVIWTKPDDWDVDGNVDLKAIFGAHPGGTNFSYADGSVHFLRDSIDPKVINKLLTKDGGEVVSSDEF
jgi:prepilin-type processing-associated H-X9-DG protein